jgi:hypothetical protein
LEIRRGLTFEQKELETFLFYFSFTKVVGEEKYYKFLFFVEGGVVMLGFNHGGYKAHFQRSIQSNR